VIRPLNPKPGTPAAVVAEQIAEVSRRSKHVIAFIIDGYRAGEHGGTGVRADWELAREVAKQRPIILAGGLDPENVEAAIAAVGPVGVDVSSGVETGGVKDIAKIEAFVRRAKLGFAGASFVASTPSPGRGGAAARRARRR
jgi:phosphoribosylanthranilate isomerase